MKKAAVFLDRDGTINEQMGYINHISRFHLLDGAAKAIRRLNAADIPVVVVTNQSGLARGYFPEELLKQVHGKMEKLLMKEGAKVDGLYICPHHPEAKMKKFRENCNCRKPKTGLLKQAAREMNIDLERSFMVGDRFSDIRCGASVGAKTILVLTGYGRGDLEYIEPEQKTKPNFIADNLSDAVSFILTALNPNINTILIRNLFLA